MIRSGHQAWIAAVLALSSLFLWGPGLFETLTSPTSHSDPAPPDARRSVEHAAEAHNCRFWGSISESIPSSVIADHLVRLPNSIRNLSAANPNGWSVAYFSSAESGATVRRGQPPAYLDPLFDRAASDAARASPMVGVSHIRRCSSGLCDIPNPHPFKRQKNGRHWLMGHNGTIDKSILLDLIRPEYLAANPPANGEGPFEWIDSELYFLYMLQTFEDFAWHIKPALGEVVHRLRESTPGESELLNFILTDGGTLWAYRQGRTLYSLYDTTGTPYSAVASQYPSSQQGDWVELSDGQLATMIPHDVPVIESIEDYFDVTQVAQPDSVRMWESFISVNCHPNPLNALTEISYTIPEGGMRSPVALRIYDVTGRLVRALVEADQPGGRYEVYWDGADRTGRSVAAGIYFYQLSVAGETISRRMVLLR